MLFLNVYHVLKSGHLVSQIQECLAHNSTLILFILYERLDVKINVKLNDSQEILQRDAERIRL